MKMKKGWLWLIGVVGLIVVVTVVAFVAPNLGGLGSFGYRASDNTVTEDAKDEYAAPPPMPNRQAGSSNSKSIEQAPGDADGMTSPSTSAAPEGKQIVNADFKQSEVYFQKQMLKKDGNITLESDDPMKSSQVCTEVAVRYGGDILNSNTSYNGVNAYVSMTIRVPSTNFEKAMNEIQKAGKATIINSTAEDVTAEFMDLQTRQATLEKLIKKLNSLLDNARNEEAMVQMYEKIAQYEQELESTKGQIKYLQGMTSFSRINIAISKPGVVVDYPTSNEFVEGLQVIWAAFLKAILYILVVLAVCLPISGIIILIVWIIKLIIRSSKPRQS